MDDTTQLQQTSGQMQRQVAPPVVRQPSPPAESTQVQQSSPQPQAIPEEDEQQPITVSAGHPEQGAVAVVEANDEDEDEQQVSPQEVKVQSAHQSEVVLPKELEAAGVKQSDAAELQLEAKMEKAQVILGNEVLPASTAPVASLPMSYEEVLQAKKTNPEAKNPYNSFTWKITEVLREWKKRVIPNT